MPHEKQKTNRTLIPPPPYVPHQTQPSKVPSSMPPSSSPTPAYPKTSPGLPSSYKASRIAYKPRPRPQIDNALTIQQSTMRGRSESTYHQQEMYSPRLWNEKRPCSRMESRTRLLSSRHTAVAQYFAMIKNTRTYNNTQPSVQPNDRKLKAHGLLNV